MQARKPGIILILTIASVFGWIAAARSEVLKEERESFRKKTGETLREMDRKIGELKSKSAEVKGEAKTEFQEQMSVLQQKKNEAKMKWKALKKTSAGEWDKAKSEVNSTFRDLQNLFDQVKSRFKDGKE